MALFAILAAAIAGLAAIFARDTHRDTLGAEDPLASLFTQGRLKDEVTAASKGRSGPSRRAADLPGYARETDIAMVRAKLEKLARSRTHEATHADTTSLDRVAELMRAGVRDGDTIMQAHGDGFVIVARGASRVDAGAIARRLAAKIERARLSACSDEPIAEIQFEVVDEKITPVAQGEWEEIKLLPAPDASPALSGSQQAKAA